MLAACLFACSAAIITFLQAGIRLGFDEIGRAWRDFAQLALRSSDLVAAAAWASFAWAVTRSCRVRMSPVVAGAVAAVALLIAADLATLATSPQVFYPDRPNLEVTYVAVVTWSLIAAAVALLARVVAVHGPLSPRIRGLIAAAAVAEAIQLSEFLAMAHHVWTWNPWSDISVLAFLVGDVPPLLLLLALLAWQPQASVAPATTA